MELERSIGATRTTRISLSYNLQGVYNLLYGILFFRGCKRWLAVELERQSKERTQFHITTSNVFFQAIR